MTSRSELDRQVRRAAAYVRQRWGRSPLAGLILGTGLGAVADRIRAEATLPYAEIPGFPSSTALSHRSLLVCGDLDGTPVVAMNGRCHLYEGYSVDQLALPVRVIDALGAGLLIVSNASGGVNPHFRAGEIMVIDDHINLMWGSPQPAGGQVWPAPRPPQRAAYDRQLIQQALSIARRGQFVAHRGVYVGVTGPTYETRSEYRLFRRIGGDAVGMSTVPEVIAAAACGLPVLALSLITNVARPDAPEVVDAEQVVVAARRAAPRMLSIVQGVLAAV